MKTRRTAAAITAAMAGALALSACSTPEVAGVEGSAASSVTVAWPEPFFSQNNLRGVNATANANIQYMTNARFFFYDDNLELQFNEDFGTITTISEDPLVVEWSVNEGVVWSDGTPFDAADLILTWGAQNPKFNTIDGVEYDDEGNPLPVADDQVFFGGTSDVMGLVSQFPEISEDGRTLTLTFDGEQSDWLMALGPTTVAAHATAGIALDIEDPQEAKDALVAAFRENDTAALAKIADTWNNGFNFTSMPSDERMFLSTGPFVLGEFIENQHLTLVRNELFDWGPIPHVDEITVRFIGESMAQVTALQNGEVDLISPENTADVMKTLGTVDRISYVATPEAVWEHITLMQNNYGPFDPATYGGDAEVARLVRQAFLAAVPRQQIVDTLITPLQPDATMRNSFAFVPGAPGYAEAVAANGSEFFGAGSNEKAAELLDQARALYPDLPETIDVRILYSTALTRRVNQFQIIQESVAPAGFNVIDAGNDNWGTILRSGDGTFDAAIFAWQSTNTLLLNGRANYVTGGLNNIGGFSDARVDEIWGEISVATDDTTPEVRALAAEMDSLLFHGGYGLPLFQHPGVVAHSDRLQNVSASTLAPTIFWNFWEWELAGS